MILSHKIIHRMAKTLRTPGHKAHKCFWTSHSKFSPCLLLIIFWEVFPLSRLWSVAVGICSATRASVSSGTDVGREVLGCSRHSNFSPRHSVWLRSWLWAGHSSSPKTTTALWRVHRAYFVHRCIVTCYTIILCGNSLGEIHLRCEGQVSTYCCPWLYIIMLYININLSESSLPVK